MYHEARSKRYSATTSAASVATTQSMLLLAVFSVLVILEPSSYYQYYHNLDIYSSHSCYDYDCVLAAIIDSTSWITSMQPPVHNNCSNHCYTTAIT